MTASGIKRVIRNALIRASKKHELIRGGCGFYKACGSTWAPNGVPVFTRKKGIDPVCAFLADRGVDPEGLSDPEGTMAELLEVSPDWVVSFLNGWDGTRYGVDLEAFRLGKKLARQFIEDVDSAA